MVPAEREPAAPARPIGEVFVLGSGRSVLQLSEQEVDYINRAECSIAINKYMAFYDLVGTLPTHVYFVDKHGSAPHFLQRIFDVCQRDHLKDITFVLNRCHRRRLSSSRLQYVAKKAAVWLLPTRNKAVFRVPAGNRFEFISHPLSLVGGTWAHSLDEPLFHFRGSLSTVLNYVSIKCPGRPVKLVGVDLNSPDYFFQDQLSSLSFPWEDWTAPIVQKEKMHFSVVKFKGTTILDRFDYILSELAKSANTLYSCNPDSLLVERGLVEYAPVIGSAARG